MSRPSSERILRQSRLLSIRVRLNDSLWGSVNLGISADLGMISVSVITRVQASTQYCADGGVFQRIGRRLASRGSGVMTLGNFKLQSQNFRKHQSANVTAHPWV